MQRGCSLGGAIRSSEGGWYGGDCGEFMGVTRSMTVFLTALLMGEDALRFMFAFPDFFGCWSVLPGGCRERDRYPSETTFVRDVDFRKNIRYVSLKRSGKVSPIL